MILPQRTLWWSILAATLFAAFVLLAACDDDGGPPSGATPIEDTPAVANPTLLAGDDTERVGIVIQGDEIVLTGQLFGGENEVGVILSHMRPNDQTAWFPFARRLADEGFAALTYDFRGYGESQGDKDSAKLDDDLREALRFMRQDRGFDTVFLVGASMGATTSLVVAAETEVAGVVAVSPPAQFEEQDALEAVPNVSAPTLLIASADDAPSLRFDELLDAAGTGTESQVYSGGAHGTALFEPASGHADAVQDLVIEFLRQHSGQ